MKYIIVQHSAFGYRRDIRFEKGLEVRSITSEEYERRFKESGAAVFDTYKEAYDFAQKEAYPEGNEPNKSDHHLIPRARGMFMRAKVDGLQVYHPQP